MTNLGSLIKQLHNERAHTEQQLQQLNQAISTLESLGGHNGFHSGRRGTRHMSAAARNRIAAAQKVRWAKWHQQHGAPIANGRGRAQRIVSAASRRKMAAAQRARWAKAKKTA